MSGIGTTTIDRNQRSMFNFGGGIRIWFGEIFSNRRRSQKNIALDIKTLGLFNSEISQNGRQLQHTVGFLFRF